MSNQNKMMYLLLAFSFFLAEAVAKKPEASVEVKSWKEDLIGIIRSDAGPVDRETIQKIVSEGADWREIRKIILDTLPDQPAQTGVFIERSNLCPDGIERPYVTYVPPAYSVSNPCPVLVWLHGGVGREKLIDNPMQHANENPLIPAARDNGWIVILPFGQAGATWWDPEGMDLIRTALKRTRCLYHIDDDRIWIGGFSDGASAAFTWAMAMPTDFAAFIALNGHMGVGSLDGKLPLCPSNMAMTPVYAVNTDRDILYPSSTMSRMIRAAQSWGADIMYREYTGIGHDFDYADSELPRIIQYLERHPRDPFKPNVSWETGHPDFGRFHWFRIDSIAAEPPAEWHHEENLELSDERVSFGFFPDQEFTGPGVRIGKLADGRTLARSLGMLEKDVIVACGPTAVRNMDDLDTAKSMMKRGDPIEVRIIRGEEKQTLEGRIPPPETYYLFPLTQPTGAAEVQFTGNTVRLETSRVSELTIFIHPDQFQLDQPVHIIWNGHTVFDEMVEPDTRFMLENFMTERDRKLLYIQGIRLKRDF